MVVCLSTCCLTERQMWERQSRGKRKSRIGRKQDKAFFQRLFCCFCLETGENDPCFGFEKNKEEKAAGVDGESVHIVVEDLGLDNPNFVVVEDQDLAQRGAMGRSASSVSSCQWAKQKKKLASLSSMPLQFSTTQGSLDSLILGAESSGTSDGDLLTPPVINLIPPTPSDVIEDDQFFDINSEEESIAHTSGSEGVDSVGSLTTGEQESEEGKEKQENDVESAEPTKVGDEEVSTVCLNIELTEEEHIGKENKVEQNKATFLRSSFQVPPLPEYPRKRSFNAGINLLQFTEHNLDDLSNKDASNHHLLKTELRLLPFRNNMEALLHQKKPAMRSCSLGETVPRSHTFQSIYCGADDIFEDEESPRQRRITVASYIPQSKDRNGNFPTQDSNGHKAKTLAEMNTEEVCQWFSNIGLEKCLPFIRGADLSGSHIASIDLNTLDVLQVSGLEEREKLLSAIYRELHPPNSTTQKLDSLLETYGPNNVEKFTAALVSMSKSKSSPHINCVSMNQSWHKFRSKGQNIQRQTNIHLVEVTINASERIVHLRTPRDTSVGKVMESCLRMLGIHEDKDLFSLKSKEGSSEEYSTNQQIGSLPGSEARLLELNLYKKEKASSDAPESPECTIINTLERNMDNKNQQINDGKIQELNLQVDSLQNVILQVQELHHGLVAFCSELKNMDDQLDTEMMSCLEIKHHLSQAQERLHEKRKSLQSLRDSQSITAIQNKRRPEVWLLEKMRLNCQVFKEEIALVHLNRQVAHLQAALEEAQVKEKEVKKHSTFAQLVSPQCPAMLISTEERADADGHYSFIVHLVEGQGLTVVQTWNSSLCLNDRLVEVNGVSVLGSSKEELADLLRVPVSQLVVLRKPSLEDAQSFQSKQIPPESGVGSEIQ